MFKIDNMIDYETGLAIEYINPGKEGQKVKMKLPIDVKPGYIIRRKR